MLASLGCGNPTALAKLNPGEVVLDLGSGGGIDVLLSAKRVGPTGKAYGLDMTDEMLALANENKRKAGAENVEFLKGEIEHIPLPDNSVDVIISNCVINLSADKDRVLREAFRVLKPGGRFAVSDVVTRGEIRPEIRQSVLLWVGCVAGALEENEYRSKLAGAGFEQIEIEPTRIYRAEDAREFLKAKGVDVDAIAPQVDGKFMSAFVKAVKPSGAGGDSLLRTVLLPLRGCDDRALQRSCSYAREIRRAPSWRRRSSITKAGRLSLPIVRGAIPRERSGPRRCVSSKSPTFPPKVYAARAGTNSLSRALPSSISFLRFVTTRRRKFVRCGPGSP